MTIRETSSRMGLTPDTLRYYERVGLIPNVGRTSGGIRDYTEVDCRWIQFIKCMRSAGLPVEVLIEYVRLFQEGEHTFEARKALLTEQRAKLVTRIDEMQETLARLDVKLARYEQRAVPAENELKIV